MQAQAKEYLLNEYLVQLFNNVLRAEEQSLSMPECDGLSLKEMHVIDTVAKCELHGANTPTHIAQLLGVTPGTLTTSVNLLIKKGHLMRERDERDGRIKRIRVTEKASAALQAHDAFHQSLVQSVLSRLSETESDAFVGGLVRVSQFFQDITEKESASL